MRLKISARQSDLARLQAYMVGDALIRKNPGCTIEYRFKESLGDKNLTDPLWKIPEKGVFTEDFNQELLSGETDMVVHSWKDLPTELRPHSEIVATLPRADQRDLLLIKKSSFDRIRSTGIARIYSSSPRRAYNLTDFLKSALPLNAKDVQFESVRGNIPTRVRKLIADTAIDGLIVAKAALDRLLTAKQLEFAEMQVQLRTYLTQLDWMVLPLAVNPNAAAQGALAIEVLKTREDLKKIFAEINHADTYFCAEQERKILASFGGGCHQKIGIAILRRPYGDVQILKGLTTAGVLLDQHEILKASSQKFAASKMWPQDEFSPFQRKALNNPLPSNANALFVTKAEAWPEALKFDQYVWTAGLQTWKRLAAKGIWVHGCSESLGENEEIRIESLASQPLNWYKISHSDGMKTDKNEWATYELIPQKEWPDLTAYKSFYWNSGSLFLAALKKFPSLASASHACGPGHTYTIIRSELEKTKTFADEKLQIFLNQNEWRQKCQI